MSSISITPAAFSARPALRPAPRPSRPAPRALRLTRRGRMVFGALAAAPLVAGLLFASVTSAASAGSAHASTTFATVTVDAGESLWAIAERIAPQADPREVIGELERLNGLADSAVLPGQTLSIPAQYAR